MVSTQSLFYSLFMIDVVHSFCNKWRLKVNVSKSCLLGIRKKESGCGESIDCLECVVIVT